MASKMLCCLISIDFLIWHDITYVRVIELVTMLVLNMSSFATFLLAIPQKFQSCRPIISLVFNIHIKISQVRYTPIVLLVANAIKRKFG